MKILGRSTNFIYRHYKGLAVALGCSLVLSILKELLRGMAMEWLVDKLGPIGRWIALDPASIFTFAVAGIVLVMLVSVIRDEAVGVPYSQVHWDREFSQQSVKGLRGYIIAAITVIFLLTVAGGLIYTTRLATLAPAKSTEPLVRFEFENAYPYILPPKDRVAYNRTWAVRVKVITDTKLTDACLLFRRVTKDGDSSWTTIDAEQQAGWYRGEDSFKCVEVFPDEFFVPFLADSTGRRLWLFVPSNAKAEYARMSEMEPGSYKVEFKFSANHAPTIIKTLSVRWSGSMSDFHMEILP